MLHIEKYYQDNDEIDLCFVDNGITIPQNFINNGINTNNDIDAIYNAINGKSTKNINSRQYERGSGLNNTINLAVNGYEGNILIVSGKV